MIKIIRLLLFCLILDAYCEVVFANAWEPDGSWITVDDKAVPLSKNTNQSQDDTSYNKERELSKITNFIRNIKSLVKENQIKPEKRRKAVPLSKNTNQSEDDTSYNKEREFSKIINFIRDIKSLVKKNQIKTEKRRKGEDEISGGKTPMPIRPSSTYRNTEDVIIKVNRKNRPDHQKLLNKLRKLLKERRKITQLKAGEEKPEKHDPDKVVFLKNLKQSSIDKKKKVQPSKPIKDEDIISSKKMKETLAEKTSSADVGDDAKETEQKEEAEKQDDTSSKLFDLINKFKNLDRLRPSANEPTEQAATQKATNHEKPRDLLKDQALWIGLVTGCCLAAMVCAMCFFIGVLIKGFKRKKDGDKRPLDLNFNCPPESYKERHYSGFSHMRDPKTGRRFIVLKDNCENYSITSSDSSSEEEIYNASQQSPSKPVLNISHRSSINRTSTPIKSPLRLTRSAPGSPAVRRDLSKSWTSPPVSPLASVTPVFASPIKLPGNEGYYINR
uniref:Uncharacterized protein LOC111123925 n=1 Tax=Crassostrea virginica TaxID=6565 RepID=A0A8B8D2P0_CRAVI|nr:uncharacterized protein LOC111123925 [Crassostrea virginica]